MNQPRFPTRPALALTLLCVAALTACGGGGSDAGSTTNAGTTAEDAQALAANSTLMNEGAGSALEVSVLAAQAVITAQAVATSNAPKMNALSTMGGETAQPAAVTSVPVTCAGGGSATLTITGGTVQSVLNGELDTGEVYQLSFAACRGTAGAASINGSLVMTVQTATVTDLSLALVANSLAVALP